MEHYTKRTIEKVTVRNISGRHLALTSGWGCYAPENVAELLSDGKAFFIEYYGGTTIGGWLIDGTWYNHKSDEDFARDLLELSRTLRDAKVQDLKTHWKDWKKRTDALPGWIRARIEHFHNAAGAKFELEGWGYELVIAELAVMLAEDRLEDSERVKKYEQDYGVSGHQYDTAKALATIRIQNPEFDFATTKSAMGDLTGSVDYR